MALLLSFPAASSTRQLSVDELAGFMNGVSKPAGTN
jgi:hypothetical protein